MALIFTDGRGRVKAGVGVAPGVDFGQAGKRAVRFSYAIMESDSRGPPPYGSTRGLIPRPRKDRGMKARGGVEWLTSIWVPCYR